MGCKYVKEFTFGPEKTYVKGYARGGYAKGGSCEYAKGGITEKETGEKYPSRKAMMKHEREETPRMQREEVIRKAEVRAPARRMVAVAPREPMIPMKKGGKMEAKVGKVMGEYKAGELHSGSAKGPVVKSRKQAVAIAMSEGRKAAKR